MLELAAALILILLNGVFSLSELAVVSARKARLRVMAEQRRAGARAALALAEEPGRFLSTVQIGITLIGVLAGAFSGAALGQRAAELLQDFGLAQGLAQTIGYGLVIGAITYLSVVVGELVPKTLALRAPERIACMVARPTSAVSRAAGPVVWFLDASTRRIFRLFGIDARADEAVTADEIRAVVAEAETAGAIETDERHMIGGVLRLGDRTVRGVMTPRTDVTWLDLGDTEEAIRAALLATPHARLPVGEGGPDEIIGVVQLRDLLPDLLRGRPLDIRAHVRPAPVVPDRLGALDALAVLRKAEVPIGLVHDEYGHFDGVITPADILDAIAGAFRADLSDSDEAVRREDGSWLLSGWMPVDEMADQLRVPLPDRRDYETVAGLEPLPIRLKRKHHPRIQQL
ncbi:hemolysin family protein [Methylobacterium nodulans]|uniref:hemolysin family protein n=1 Tax=Methylobacterium nodulans TaxID=114616 RepID=UPI000A01A296|nr:hemolysin family protein [Methylobacterium nodulans]